MKYFVDHIGTKENKPVSKKVQACFFSKILEAELVGKMQTSL